MGVLSSKYPNVQAVENALNKACESVSQTDFNTFKSNVYTKSDTEAYTTEEKNKLSGISEGANKTVIDTTLSSISTNPVQNKVIKTSLDSKANSSDVYTKTESDSRFLGVEGTAVKATADGNGINIAESFATDKNNIALNRTTLGYQCKNLLKNNAVTQTVSGVTFTVNSDGSVTVNGTNTSSSTGANFEICGFKNYGTGKLTASLNSTDSNLYMSVFDKSWIGIGSVCDEEITWDNGNKERVVRLAVKPGATINNVTVYPMIRYTDITDSTYEPYKPSLQEQINALTARISALEGGV